MPPRANWRNAIAFAHDVAAIAVAWCLAYLFRLNFELEQPFAAAMVNSLTWVVPLQAPFFLALGMYRGLWRYASFHDLRRIVFAAALGAMAIALVILLFRIPWVPRSVLLLYPILLAAMMGGSRIAYRAWKEGHLSRLASEDGRRVVVLGAGSAAANLLGNLGRNAEWRFVGLLDDDPTKLRREIHGVPVLGSLTDLPAIAAAREVELAIIAMPKASHRVRRRALELCSQAGVAAMTVPSYEDLVSGKVTVSQLRRVELDDLLGRDPVTLDSEGLQQLGCTAAWCSSPAPAARSARSCAGRSLRFGPARLVLLETTSSRSTASSRSSVPVPGIRSSPTSSAT